MLDFPHQLFRIPKIIHCHIYEWHYLYFEPHNEKQEFEIKNSFTISQSILLYDLYTFKCVDPCVIAFFPSHLRHHQNIVFSNYVVSNKNKSFSRINVHAYFIYAGGTNA